MIEKLHIQNYRTLADVTLDLGPVNVFFGPNGAGKSSLLDALWFLHDCADRDVAYAVAQRNYGRGAHWNGAVERDPVVFELTAKTWRYELELAVRAGRFVESPAEKFTVDVELDPAGHELFRRSRITNNVHSDGKTTTLSEPSRLALEYYKLTNPEFEQVGQALGILKRMRCWATRSWALADLKRRGSDASVETSLTETGTNLWAILRGLKERQSIDHSYTTIIRFMKRSFPELEDLLIESVGMTGVLGSFLFKNQPPVAAFWAADGYLHMLLLLTALFGEGATPNVLLFDEPETALHPWALEVFSEAVYHATKKGHKQVLLATHSPVLLSQFAPNELLAVERLPKGTQFRRLADIAEIQDLLENYAPGTLYMTQNIGAQAPPVAEVPA